MIEEEWRPIPGLEGLYDASSAGNIRSCGRVIACRASRTRAVRAFTQRIAERVMKPYLAKNGYYTVVINTGGVGRTQSVHRLVALAFLGEPDEPMHVNHIDGCKTNNRADNLEWVAPAENMAHACRTGLLSPRRGEASGTAKLTEEEVREIRGLLARGLSQRKIAAQYGIGQRTVGDINTRKKWAHLA